MKKFFLLFIFFAQIYNINALEYDYSEWSEEYPNDVNEILIESEDRFLCYSEEKENIEYLIKEEIKDKLYDESDYQYYESEEVDEEPIHYSERIIKEIKKEIFYTSKDAYGMIIPKVDIDLTISEIEINTIDGINIPFSSNKDYLNDKDLLTYYPLNDDIIISFNKHLDLNNILITIYFNNNSVGNYIGNIDIISSDNNIVVSSKYGVALCQSPLCKLVYNKNNFKDYNSFIKKTYKYTDKLYKTYNIKSKYTEEYLSSCGDLLKDEENKKTYYRYITNEYVIIDVNGNVVKDENYCRKLTCELLHIARENESLSNNIINPKTYDPLYDSIVLFIVGIITLIYFIVEKRRLIKKSNNVESLLIKRKIL